MAALIKFRFLILIFILLILFVDLAAIHDIIVNEEDIKSELIFLLLSLPAFALLASVFFCKKSHKS